MEDPCYKNCYNQWKRAKRMKRVPAWVEFQRDMLPAWRELLPDGPSEAEEIDHIIPFKGKYASGLHVPDNLQVITRQENMSKSNKFEVE